MRNGSNFVFEIVDLLPYHIHKASLKRGNLYINPPEWIANKKSTINTKNEDDKCFKYFIIVALHYTEFKSHPERLSNMIHFFSCDCNWEGIEFPTGTKDWKRFQKNNETIALNILQAPHNKTKISHAYKSEYNKKRKRKNQVLLLMTSDGEKWHYIALKRKSTDDGFNRPTKSLY